jgi:hypothetical protein
MFAVFVEQFPLLVNSSNICTVSVTHPFPLALADSIYALCGSHMIGKGQQPHYLEHSQALLPMLHCTYSYLHLIHTQGYDGVCSTVW